MYKARIARSKSTFNRLATFATVASCLAAPVWAADYFVVVPVKGRTAAPAPELITVALSPYTMPDAREGTQYSFNLAPLLQVTGDSAYSGAGVTWSVVSNTLPAGLYLTSDGFITGKPAGAGSGAITVRATYKAQNGEQTYQVVSAALTVTLASAQLPGGMIGTAYSYDFKPLLSSNDPTFNIADARFRATNLPTGLSLSPLGALYGTPTVRSEAGTSFNVYASYKEKEGPQVYTLVVEGSSLKATKVATGKTSSCAIMPDTTVKCWGLNSYGQLGNGTLVDSPIPVTALGLTGVKDIAIGFMHACAVLSDGTVKCWGLNNYSQLGKGTVGGTNHTPVTVPGLTNVKSVAAGYGHTCVVLNDGAMKCWGDGQSGQLGQGNKTSFSTPVTVQGLPGPVAQIALGKSGAHTCAVTVSGGAYCWGLNNYGQVGNGGSTDVTYPTLLSGYASGVKQLDTGYYESCLVKTNNALVCWGTLSKALPTVVPGITDAAAVAVGGSIGSTYMHKCVLTTTGGVKCLGVNYNGQLGNGTFTNSTTPVNVIGLSSGVQQITSSYSHNCAITAANGTKCWGINDNSQLGDGSKVDKNAPVEVTVP